LIEPSDQVRLAEGYLDGGEPLRAVTLLGSVRESLPGDNTVGQLRVVGRTSPLPLAARAELRRLLRPPRTDHPWPRRLPSSRLGQTPGTEIEDTQVAPELVVEIETDTAYEQGRWRHATKYLRPTRPRARGGPADVEFRPARSSR
jgi:ATP-dependent DNA ligase